MKKTTAKSPAKAPATAQDVKNLPLPAQLAAKRAELLTARQGLGSTLQNPHRIKALKKDIARLLTAIRAAKADESTTTNATKGDQ